MLNQRYRFRWKLTFKNLLRFDNFFHAKITNLLNFNLSFYENEICDPLFIGVFILGLKNTLKKRRIFEYEEIDNITQNCGICS